MSVKQALSITKAEKRHEFMLSVMEDRASNYDNYQLERFSKYSPEKKGSYPWLYMRKIEHKLMQGCKHEDKFKAISQQLKVLDDKRYELEEKERQAKWEQWERKFKEKERERLDKVLRPVSKQTSKSIDEFLEEGLTTLKVRWEGNDFSTKYYFVPVTNGTA
jgi:hypothetical protein